MRHLSTIWIILLVHTTAWGQGDWGIDIKNHFVDENYGRVISLCENESKSETTLESTPHDYTRKRILIRAKECLALTEEAQELRRSNPNEAKIKFEKIISIRTDIWPLIGNNQTIHHPQTALWIAEIENKRAVATTPASPSYNNNISTTILNNAYKLLSRLNDSYFTRDASIISNANYTTDSFNQSLASLLDKRGWFYSIITDQQMFNYPIVRHSDQGWTMNIPVVFELGEESLIKIEFTIDGKITNIAELLPELRYRKIEDDVYVEESHFETICDFVEKFRLAYINRDINFLEDVFSDYAVIIVGKDNGMHLVVREDIALPSIRQSSRYKFTEYTKDQYLKNLRNVFYRNKRMNILFSDIEVQRNHNYEYVYGVTLKQEWYSSSYNDIGWVFLLIKFNGLFIKNVFPFF